MTKFSIIRRFFGKISKILMIENKKNYVSILEQRWIINSRYILLILRKPGYPCI